jgi:hypothetical protein
MTWRCSCSSAAPTRRPRKLDAGDLARPRKKLGAKYTKLVTNAKPRTAQQLLKPAKPLKARARRSKRPAKQPARKPAKQPAKLARLIGYGSSVQPLRDVGRSCVVLETRSSP